MGNSLFGFWVEADALFLKDVHQDRLITPDKADRSPGLAIILLITPRLEDTEQIGLSAAYESDGLSTTPCPQNSALF